jgi:glutamate/tyrosine decarboxylase-like PLP-dependent enzyme
MENRPEIIRPSTVEETLDPASWDELRALAHQMVDDALSMLQTIREKPVWQPVPEKVKQNLNQPLPERPENFSAVYQEFLENIFPYPMGNIHPRFWGWVIGTGDPVGVLAEMMAATMNPNLGGGDHVANYVEAQVLSWCKQIMGYPTESSGLLVSGGSMANLVGLAVARNVMAAQTGFDLRKSGLRNMPQQLVLYASTQAHSSIQKGIEVLGIGNDALRLIPVDASFQIRVDLLRESISRDRQQGCLPFCVVGNAGTVNTGAYDDLHALADISHQEGLWFHVDGAFGALAVLSPELAPLTSGMERADSLAFDLHKWISMPIEIGCTLVRKEEDHRSSFALSPDYLAHTERGLAGGHLWFSEYGIQLSRGFRALKAWMMLKTHGTQKYGRIIQQNVDQARYLSELVDAAPELERLAPTALNIVCFRYTGNVPETERNALNQELLIQLHEKGIAVPSYTMLDGKYALRVANVNHRSVRSDFDLLIQEVLRIGKELEAKSITPLQ